MSYDLMVFAPEAAPSRRPAFLDWYDEQTEWDDDLAYDDPAVATPALQAFYADLAAEFPPIPDDRIDADADADADADGAADYTIAPSLIYMNFVDWDRVDAAWEAVHRLAAKHELGFFDVSSDLGEVWLPDRKGGLRIASSD